VLFEVCVGEVDPCSAMVRKRISSRDMPIDIPSVEVLGVVMDGVSPSMTKTSTSLSVVTSDKNIDGGQYSTYIQGVRL
jgi:hypothetical protein